MAESFGILSMSDDTTAVDVEGAAAKKKKAAKTSETKRGTLIYEAPGSVRKANLTRERLISFSSGLNVLLAVALLASSALSAYMMTRPIPPANFYVQYLSGKINEVKSVSKERLPAPIPLEIRALEPHARLDDAPGSNGYAVTESSLTQQGTQEHGAEDAPPATPPQAAGRQQ